MPKDKTVYSLHESVLLIILAALDKVYDADAIALGIPMYEVGTFITKVGEKLAQRELCSPDEATKHSAMKLVHNSKFALLKIVNGLDEEQVIESVFHIVQRCQHDYTRKRLYINVMLFDTLNQLFQDSPKRAELIKKYMINFPSCYIRICTTGSNEQNVHIVTPKNRAHWKQLTPMQRNRMMTADRISIIKHR